MKFFFNVILFMHVCFSFSFQQGLRFPGYSISLTLKKKFSLPSVLFSSSVLSLSVFGFCIFLFLLFGSTAQLKGAIFNLQSHKL
jgi:hypothetical protein